MQIEFMDPRGTREKELAGLRKKVICKNIWKKTFDLEEIYQKPLNL